MNQPPMPGYSPPPPQRQGKPWWVWLLFGCAGCAVLVVIGGIILGVTVVNTAKTAMNEMGPVTAASVKESLGADLPTYPGGQLQIAETKAVLMSFRIMEKVSGKGKGAFFGGAAMYSTPDDTEKVLKYYDTEMEKAGWTKFHSQKTGFQTQIQYKKGNEFGIVQVQKSPGTGGTMITLMRGGSELVEMNRKRQEQSGLEPAPAK